MSGLLKLVIMIINTFTPSKAFYSFAIINLTMFSNFILYIDFATVHRHVCMHTHTLIQ